jgi:ADP-heptose:LPS heptosyltransferase
VTLPNPARILPDLAHGSRILVIRLRSLGDTVLLTPALTALHDWRPDLRVSVLLEPAFAPILDGNPAVDEALVLQATLETIRAIRSRKFAAVLNQHGGTRSALLTAASGAPARIGWSKKQLGFAYSTEAHGFEAYFGRPTGHTAEHAISMFYWAGLPQGPIPPARVYPQPPAVQAVAVNVAARGIEEGTPYAVLRPGAAAASKRWPVERFAWLAKRLREEQNLATVVNLGPGDEEIAAAVRAAFAPDTVILDSLDLHGLVALLAGARLFVGNDSGPTHIASALERPVVVIFGDSNPIHWAPWQTRHRLLRKPAAGSIGDVPPEKVAEACAALLAETASRAGSA